MAQGYVMYKKGSCTVTISDLESTTVHTDTYDFTMSYNDTTKTVTLNTSSPVWWNNGVKQMTFKNVGDQGHEFLAFGFGVLTQANDLVEVDVTMTQAGPNPILEIGISIPQKKWDAALWFITKVLGNKKPGYSISPPKIELIWETEKYFTWDISGKVETATGQPVPGATIKAYLNGTKLLKSTQSSSNGSYTFSLQVPVGTYAGNQVVLKTTKTNYSFRDVYVNGGGTYNIQGYYYQIAPTKHTIAGRLEDGNGNGIPNIKMIYQSIPKAPANSPTAYYAVTDSKGYFEFKNQLLGGFVSPISWDLPAKYQQCKWSQVEVDINNYSDIIITLHCPGSSSMYTITGKVISAETGKALPGAKVSYNGKTTYTKSDGSFSLGITNLGGTLSVSDKDYDPFSKEINFSSDLNVGTVGLKPIVSPNTYYIQGTVEDSSTGKGLSGALVSYNGKYATTASDGSFEFKNITLEKQLKVSKSGYDTVSMYIYDTQPDLVISLEKKGSNINYVQYVYVVEDQSGNGIPGIQLVIGGTKYTTNNGGEVAVKLSKGTNPVKAVSSISDPSGNYGDFKVVSTVGTEVVYQGIKLNSHNCGTNAKWNGSKCVCKPGYQRDSSGNCVKKTIISQTTPSNTFLIIGAALLALIVLMKK